MRLLRDNLLLVGVLAGIFIVISLSSAWNQLDLLGESDSADAPGANDPDYFIENLTSTTIGENERKYRIIADRLVHYPATGRSLLNNPQVIQYGSDQALSHTYADTGWVYDDQSTVFLDGNVRVVDNWDGVPRSVATSDKMTINLKSK